MNAFLFKILDHSKGSEHFKWPGRLKGDPEKRDRSKYCDLHKVHGHTTDECKALKYEVDELIKQGRLRQFVSGRNDKSGKRGSVVPTPAEVLQQNPQEL